MTRPGRSPGSRVGHVGARHPLCPECSYDLVATIEARGRRCPECGSDFELSDVATAARPGDWTPTRGLRRAALVLLIKGIVCAGAWALALIAEHHLGRGMITRVPLGLAVLLTGGAVGWFLVRGLDETLGFLGLAVAAALSLVAIVVLFAGATIAVQFGGVPAADTAFAFIVGGVASTAFIVKTAFIDEQ